MEKCITQGTLNACSCSNNDFDNMQSCRLSIQFHRRCIRSIASTDGAHSPDHRGNLWFKGIVCQQYRGLCCLVHRELSSCVCIYINGDKLEMGDCFHVTLNIVSGSPPKRHWCILDTYLKLVHVRAQALQVSELLHLAQSSPTTPLTGLTCLIAREAVRRYNSCLVAQSSLWWMSAAK